MADERIKIILDAGMDISDVQANAKQIQSILKSFKMPAALSEDFEKQFKILETEITKIQAQMKAGFKTKGDITGLEKSTKTINTVFGALKNLYSTFENEHLMMNVDFDTDEIKQARKDLADLQQQLKSKINTTEFTNLGEKIKEIGTLSKSSAVKNLKESFSSLDLSNVRSDLDSVVGGLTNFAKGNKDAVAAAKLFQDAWSSGKLDDIDDILTEMTPNMQKVAIAARDARKDLDALGNSDIGQLSNEVQKTTQHIRELENSQVDKVTQDTRELGQAFDQAGNHAEQCGNSIKGAANDMYSFNGQIEQVKNRVKDFFSLTNSVLLFRRGVQKAFEAVKELDAAMTETAVVTDFNVGDMWDQLPRYTAAANELGTTTLGAYETMTLFYQQGLETNEVFEIGTETMKMARIAGLDYANATDLMTAALRGFNMELNETSATRINDVYSELAAITAADTSEIANAMTKTASIAANANMEFETTAALLSQIIETTREPAETAGTAMKTIIARFTEMKKASSDVINVDGEEVSVNKVEAALKSAGVALRDVNGEFRDLDDVFLELSSKWNGLDKMTQRYVATMAAGSRQQSRFIAMMQDYDRTMELVDAAYNSSGASQKQFEKTQDSLESKINKLKNAWNEFLMGISNSKVIKAGVDALTALLNIINKLTGNSGLLKLGVAIGALAGGNAIFNGLLKSFTPLKGLMNKEGGETAVSFIGGLTQKLNNFKAGKPFVLDADVDTKGVHNKIGSLRTDWSNLIGAIKNPVPISMDSTVKSFEILNGKLITTSTLANGTTQTLETGLSETSIKALIAAESADKVGDEIAESGISGKAALDILEREYLELIALQEAAQKAGNTTRANDLGKQANNVKSTMNALKGTSTTTQGLGQALGGVLSKLGPIAKWLAIIAAVVAAIAAAAYAIYDASPLKKAKDDAERAASAVEDYKRAIETTKTEVNALNSSLEELRNRQDVFASLVEGSAEWYQAIQDSNAALLEQIQLLQAMGYNIEYFYDEQGILQTDPTALRTAQAKASQEQLELQKASVAAENANRVHSLVEEIITINASPNSEVFNKNLEDYNNRLIKEQENNIVPIEGDNDNSKEFLKAIWGFITAYNKANNFSEEQKQQIQLASQQSAAGTWGLYATDEIQRKAGQAIIANLDDAYTTLYSNEAIVDNINKTIGGEENRYTFDDDGNDELKIDQGDITADDLGNVIKDLGYRNWNEAATALGLQWDSEVGGAQGLYVAGEDGKKQYIDVSSHGGVDTAEEWSSLLADPTSGWHFGDSKNVDAGYLALKLAEAKHSSSGIANLIKGVMGKDAEKILYGTEYTNGDWADLDTTDKTGLELAKINAINRANQRKRDIKTSLQGSTQNGEGGIFTDAEATRYASQIQKLETDINTATALGYQAFITEQKAMSKKTPEELGPDYKDIDWNEQTEQEYYELFSKINLEDATGSLAVLNKEIEEGNIQALHLKETLTSTGGSLDISHQFSDLLTSGVIDELSEDIAKLSDEAGNIDVTATRELIDSNVELKNIMDEFDVSGYAMGKILTDIQNGELTLTEINEGLIESYKLLYSAMGQAEDVLYDLRNADLGEDYTEIGRTYEERYNTAKDLYKRGAWGSENFAGNIKSLIGDEEWQTLLNDSGGSTKKAYEKAVKKYRLDKNNGNLYGSFSSLIASGATDKQGRTAFRNENGKIAYDFSDFESYDDVLDHMVEAFGVSREYAKAMLADMATYSDTLQADLNSLNAVAAAKKNYESMYFQEEEVTDENGKPKTKTFAYTSQTDAELANVYGQTQQWADAEAAAKAAYIEENKNNAEAIKWEDLTEQERQAQIATAFKDENNIVNTVEVDETDDQGITNKVKKQITKVDSQGNKYYKDKDGKTQIQDKDDNDKRKYTSTGTRNERTKDKTEYQYKDDEWKSADGKAASEADQAALNADSVQAMLQSGFQTTIEGVEVPITFESVAEQAKMETQDVIQGLQEIANDPIVQKMATELDSEEYDAWLAANYGENAPEIMISAGFDQSSIAQVAAARDEMITQIQGVAQALETLEVTIPIKMPAIDSALEIGDGLVSIPIGMTEIDTAITIGGEGTSANFVGNTSSSGSGSTSVPPVEVPFKPTEEEKPQGEGYPTGDDPTNGGNGGGGGGDEKTAAEQTNYGAENSDAQLEELERLREVNEREAELIGKLPEQIRPFFEMANLAEKMGYEYQEIQINKNKLGYLQQQQELAEQEAEAKGYLGEYFYKDEALGQYMWDLEAMEGVTDSTKRDEIEEFKNNLDGLNDKVREVEAELDGGKIQAFVKALSKGAKSVSTVLKSQGKDTKDVDKALRKLEKQLGLTEGSLQPLSDKFKEIVSNSKYLNSEFEGLSDSGDKMVDIFKSGPLGRFMSDETAEQLKNGGVTKGQMGGSILGDIGDALGFSGDLLNFDMMGMGMDMFNMGKGIMDQGKQMAEQVIGYITQATQVLVDAWTNREDYLYNFLQIIEKYLHDYEKMQRYSTQLEKGRMATVDDIRASWEQQWQSLQEQLEMQQERLETRQQQLDMSRWSPFMLISGWNPETDALYENREVKMLWDVMIGAIGMLPMGLGAFGQQLNQLYEDYDKRVQEAYEDRLAAEMAILDIEDERLELVKVGSEETVEFQDKVLEAMVQKEQEQIDELTRLNEAITEANSKLISTLQSNLEQIRQDRENEKKEEELSEKQRRLSYLRQDTSGANAVEIKKLEEQLEDEHEDYTDTLIDQKISELEKQNELAAEQRQQQIDLLQAQLDWSEKYGLYWDAIYGMLYTIDENGNVILNPENFDLDGNIRENGELAKMLGTFSDQIGMSLWAQVLEMDELKRLGRYAGAFVGHNGLDGQWADYWALLNPGADDPDYAEPDPVIPDGFAGVLWKLEHGIREYFARSDGGLIDTFGHAGEKIANGLGDLFGIESWSAYDYKTVMRGDVGAPATDFFVGLDRKTNAFFDELLGRGNKYTQNLNNKGIVTAPETSGANVGPVYFQVTKDANINDLLAGIDRLMRGDISLLDKYRSV